MVNEQQLVLFLLQVLLLLSLGRSLGELFRRWGHPPLVGELLVGIALGPTLFGRFATELQQTLFPTDLLQQTMLETVSWIGVLFLLLDTGLQVDVSAAWRQRGPALKVGILGVLLPLTLGSILSLGLPVHYHATPERPILFALFLGTTMSISALAVMARVLYDLDLIKSDLGLLTLCGYAVNDLLAWVIFSLLLALAATSTVALPTTALFFGLTLTFTTLCLTLGRRMVDSAITGLTTHMSHQPGIVFTFVCCLGFSCGALTHGLGLNALFGFFLAGLMAGEARTLSERTRHIMSQMVHALFVPLYFTSVGLHFDFFATFDLRLAAFVTVVSIVGKFLGAWIGTLGTSLSRADRLSVGIAFTPGGVTEIILAKAALDAQIFTVPVFVAVVVAALFSSLLVGPLLMWSIRRRREVDMREFFVQRTSVPYLRSTTRWEVIEELCQTLASHAPRLDLAGLAQAVRTQEELMGTGRGEGIAIPYARVESLQKPILTVGYSLHGVEWDAPDGLPVHLVFVLLTPAGDDGLQLQILAALARTLHGQALHDRLARAENERQVWLILEEALGAQQPGTPVKQQQSASRVSLV